MPLKVEYVNLVSLLHIKIILLNLIVLALIQHLFDSPYISCQILSCKALFDDLIADNFARLVVQPSQVLHYQIKFASIWANVNE